MSVETPPQRSTVARERGVALTGLVVGGALLLLAGSRPWAHHLAGGGAGPRVSRGAQDGAASLATAGGLLFLAAVGGVIASRGAARRVVGVVVVMMSLVVVVTSVAHRPSGPDATLIALGNVTTRGSAWSYLAIVGGLLTAISGVLTATRGPSWPAMGSRYESGPPEPKPHDVWSAMDRGIDPTDDDDHDDTNRPRAV